jgi:hypothetical protein
MKSPGKYKLRAEQFPILEETSCVAKSDHSLRRPEQTARFARAAFAVSKGNVVQVHGIGPFKIYWVK